MDGGGGSIYGNLSNLLNITHLLTDSFCAVVVVCCCFCGGGGGDRGSG